MNLKIIVFMKGQNVTASRTLPFIEVSVISVQA